MYTALRKIAFDVDCNPNRAVYPPDILLGLLLLLAKKQQRGRATPAKGTKNIIIGELLKYRILTREQPNLTLL